MLIIDKEGQLREGGQIALNITELLKDLFLEDISTSKGFDKKAKKIIRSQYKLLTERHPEQQVDKNDNFKSEHKDYHRSALAALGEGNVSTNDTDHHKDGSQSMKKVNGKKIINFYKGELSGMSSN